MNSRIVILLLDSTERHKPVEGIRLMLPYPKSL